ncbi:MAG: tRNA dihydrouridine(20/20a) synthase DusA [Xanthomonadales bacterium]|jgi:tRNA-dihydrouridine synthase A|nr:tRNA dihydrouridine(20/20a) synthase DusA [Xanthomonadales bacterium]MDH3923603.1 tRNA dihydrouridine(20/20a) synthase DusA [Xanthomonadales bacterium]MDH3939354.1 tRNA dihydrouridine(20/20a) synthase DusA [Xanthomonadales bacterium]MDH4001219.1 tRNA dihydrouridine(20/20a) synthase DusA [Xanthomonadales bacterium]
MANTAQSIDRRLSVAPMMDWTDRHCRYFHRLLAPAALLYTEMVTTGAVLHGDRQRLMGYSPEEHPLALQLGGSDPADLAACARIAEQYGYDEVNLNVGCPSDRVQRGRFGACLMLEPGLVHDCVQAMREAVGIPVTVKTRLGVDDCYSYSYFSDFVGAVARSGCDVFIVHARKAWLTGLSPKENRDVPELRYDWVMRLKEEHPELTIAINGGITTVQQALDLLEKLDGVMLGRAAYHTPWILAELQRELFAAPGVESRDEAVELMSRYVAVQTARGVPVKNISRHLLGLFQGLPGARRWRRYISENAHLDAANSCLLAEAREHMRRGIAVAAGSAIVQDDAIE